MSRESAPRPPMPDPAAEFGLNEQEKLWGRISHERLRELLADEATSVHRLEESYNNYGEFVFVTLSRPGKSRRIWVGLYGLGYHEYRERWLKDEWYWYQTNPLPDILRQDLSREEALEHLEERHREIASRSSEAQSGRGKLFEMLADLTDEYGAYTEMEDLGGLADWLADGLE